MHILSFLPETGISSRGVSERDALIDSMGQEFTRTTFLQRAEEMGINKNTAASWLSRMQRCGLVESKSNSGLYRKP